jgi:hypothetical protein
MIHPEEYLGSRFTDKYIPHNIIKDYVISNTIHLWIKYFLSLGLRLEKDGEGGIFEYMFTIRYNGNGFYELRFFLERDKDSDGLVVTQNVPYSVQSEIEELIDADERNFIDCDPWTGEIYISLDYEKYYMKYVRSYMINGLLNKIKNNFENK